MSQIVKTPEKLVSEARVLSFSEGLTMRVGILKTVRAYCEASGEDYNSKVTATFHYNGWKYGVAGPPPGMEDANGQIVGKARDWNEVP